MSTSRRPIDAIDRQSPCPAIAFLFDMAAEPA
jgi:hypothetical protein